MQYSNDIFENNVVVGYEKLVYNALKIDMSSGKWYGQASFLEKN